MSAPDVNLDELELERINAREADEAFEWLESRYGQQAQEAANPQAGGDKESGQGVDDLVAGRPAQETLGQTITRNLSPIGLIGGMLKGAITEPIRMGREIDQALGLPRVVFGGEGGLVDIQSAEESKDVPGMADMLPDVGPPGIAKSIGQFMGGFIGAGKALKSVGALQGIAQSGRLGATGVAALKGAIADFASFDDMENSVNGLIQMFPVLDQVIPDFLEAKEEDPELLNRLKNTLFGLGFGAMTDTVIWGIRSLRGLRQAKPAIDEVASTLKKAEDIMATQKQEITRLLGDPDDARLIVDDVTEATAKVVDDAAGEATGFAGVADETITGPKPNASGKPGEVFVNWARMDTVDDVKVVMKSMADSHSESIYKSRGGEYMSLDQIKADSRLIDAMKIVEARRYANKAVPLDPAQTAAMRDLYVKSGEKLYELRQIAKANPGPIQEAALVKQFQTHALVQNVYLGAQTATARSMNAFRIPAKSGVAEWTMQMEHTIRGLGDGRSAKQIIAALDFADATNNQEAAVSFVNLMGNAMDIASDMANQWMYFSMLSGGPTQSRNILGNSIMLPANLMARKAANLIGQILDEPDVVNGETTANLVGIIQGVKGAFKVNDEVLRAMEIPESANALQRFWAASRSTPFGKALIDMEPGLGIGKPEAAHVNAFNPGRYNINPDSALGMGMRMMEGVTSTASRGMMAIDEIFKSINLYAESNALAFRQATNEVAEGVTRADEFAERMAALIDTEGVRLAGVKAAARNTFTETPLDTHSWQFAKKLSQYPYIGRLVAPFMRTGYNLTIESMQWNPLLAPLTRRFREELAAGGARAKIATAKFGIGGAVAIEVARWVLDGKMRGNGLDLSRTPQERETRERVGQRAMTFSVKTDSGEWTVGFRGMSPASEIVAFTANVVDLMQSDEFGDEDRSIDELFFAGMAAMISNITDASFFKGFSEISAVMDNPVGYSENYIANALSGRLVPAMARDIAKAQDPTMREITSVWDAMSARAPGKSGQLGAKVDAWGNELTRESGLGLLYDTFAPFYVTPVNAQPIDKWLYENEKWFGKPDRNLHSEKASISLRNRPKAFERLVKLRGQEVKNAYKGGHIRVPAQRYVSEGRGFLEEMNAIVKGEHRFSPIWETLSDGAEGGKAAAFDAISKAYMEEAKKYLLDEFPDIKAELDERRADLPGKYKTSRAPQYLGD